MYNCKKTIIWSVTLNGTEIGKNIGHKFKINEKWKKNFEGRKWNVMGGMLN